MTISVTDVARLCHEANRHYCEILGDTSQPDWAHAPAWQRESAENGVLFHLNNPEATPEDSHKNWFQQKVEDGWKYGEVKDPEAKTHPCMVEYDKLPDEQRVKDSIFMGIINAVRDQVEDLTEGEDTEDNQD